MTAPDLTPEDEIVSDADLRCRCGSTEFVSVSLNGGYTRIPQCVPCGRYLSGVYGYGSQSSRWDAVWRRRTYR